MDFDDSIIAGSGSEHESFLDDEKSAKKKRMSDRRRRRKYKFSDKHHTKRGILASALIIPGIAMIVISIVLAHPRRDREGQ